MEWRLARLESLIERRPLLLNSVLLRQNPQQVSEWLKRVHLLETAGRPCDELVDTFTEAVRTVMPATATGKLHLLWVEFGKFYERHDQLDDVCPLPGILPPIFPVILPPIFPVILPAIFPVILLAISPDILPPIFPGHSPGNLPGHSPGNLPGHSLSRFTVQYALLILPMCLSDYTQGKSK